MAANFGGNAKIYAEWRELLGARIGGICPRAAIMKPALLVIDRAKNLLEARPGAPPAPWPIGSAQRLVLRLEKGYTVPKYTGLHGRGIERPNTALLLTRNGRYIQPWNGEPEVQMELAEAHLSRNGAGHRYEPLREGDRMTFMLGWSEPSSAGTSGEFVMMWSARLQIVGDEPEHNSAFEEALELLKEEISPRTHEKLDRVGWWTRRKLERGLQLLGRALELQPANWRVMWLTGMVYKRLGDYANALCWFASAHRIHPDLPEISRESCLCALESGRQEEALAFALRGVAAAPRDACLRAHLAIALLFLGRPAEAREAITRAVQDGPPDGHLLSVQEAIERFLLSTERPAAKLATLKQAWRQYAQPC